jgi:glyoxylase-like metal-dependent hydrolase (beta-lactamase superfamily II)
MKSLHRKDLFGWSEFNEERNVDFNSVLWTRSGGNVVVDPLALSMHDHRHFEALGGAEIIVVTNSDHTRCAEELKAMCGATLVGPKKEQADFPIACDRWVGEGDEIVPGLVVIEMDGSKTPGELTLLLEESTLIASDLVRAHRAGRLNTLPKEKIQSRERAVASIERLLEWKKIDAVLVGDGFSVYRDGYRRLEELVAELKG